MSEIFSGLNAIREHTKHGGCRLRIDLWDYADDYAFAEYRFWFCFLQIVSYFVI